MDEGWGFGFGRVDVGRWRVVVGVVLVTRGGTWEGVGLKSGFVGGPVKGMLVVVVTMGPIWVVKGRVDVGKEYEIDDVTNDVET